MNIGDTISKLRKEKGITQQDLASKLNVSPKTISSWENNRNIPSIDMLILLSNELNTNIDVLLDLNAENKQEKSKLYEKKSFKDNLIKVIIIGIIFVIPILFFWYAGYITIAAYTAHIWAFENSNLIETSHMMTNLFTSFVIEYFIYLIIIFINYILYNKKHTYILLVINTIILAILALNWFDYALIILLILIIIEIILAITKSQKSLFYLNIITAILSLIIYIVTIFTKGLIDLDYIIFAIASIIGIYWAITKINA